MTGEREAPLDLEALMAVAPLPTLVVRERRVAWANAAALRLLELGPEELLGRPFTDLLPAGERERADARQERRLHGLPEPAVYESSLRCGREVRPVQVNAAHVGDAILVQLFDLSGEAVRRLRLTALARFGATVQREARREDVARAVRETLSRLGVEYALLRPEGDGLRLESAELEPWHLRRLARALGPVQLVGSLRPWTPFDREAWTQGAAYTDDWRMGGGLVPEELLAAERVLPGTRKLGGIGVRIDVGGRPGALLVAVASWLRSEDLPTFRLFGGQIGAALDAALAVDTLASRDAELAALNRVAEAASLSPDLGSFLDRASVEARALVSCDMVAFFLVDAERREARLLHVDGADAAERRELTRLPLEELGLRDGGDAPSARVWQEEDLAEGPRQRLRRLGLRTAAMVPLRFRSALLGSVAVGFRKRRHAAAIRLDLLQAMAAHLAGALDTHRLLGDLRGRLSELTLLNDVALATAAEEPRELLGRILHRMASTFKADAAAAYLVEGEELVHVAALGLGGDTLRELAGRPLRATVLGAAMAERRTVQRVGPGEASRGMEWFWRREALNVLVAVPLMVREGVRGVLALARRRPEPFEPPHLQLLSAIGVQVGVALENARLYAEARRRVEELSAASAGLAAAQDRLVRRERLAAIGELAAVVAHEVRNPLGVIFNSLGSLRRLVKPTGDALLLLDMASEEAGRLNRIVGDLLDFARPSPLELKREPLLPVVDGAVAAALGTAGGRVALVREVAEGMPLVPMDARLVRQALLNVAMNAVQAMPEGGTLTVKVEAGDGAAAVVISDTGPGIPEAVRARIFEPFFTTRPTGTGLGLAVVKRILDDHRGAVELCPAPGGGTCFTLRLPLGSSAEAAAR